MTRGVPMSDMETPGEAFERRQRRGWYKALGASIAAGMATGLGYSLAM